MTDSDFREGGIEICKRRDNSSTFSINGIPLHRNCTLSILDKGERRSCSRRFPSRKNVIESTRNSYRNPLSYCLSSPRNARKEYETEIEGFTLCILVLRLYGGTLHPKHQLQVLFFSFSYMWYILIPNTRVHSVLLVSIYVIVRVDVC